MSIQHSEKTLNLEQLQSRFAQVAEFMAPRIELSDGTLGYRLTATTTLTIKIGAEPFEPGSPEETIVFDVRDCEVKVPDPVLTTDGALRFDIEIFRIVSESVSTTLFGTEVPLTMKVGRGVDPLIRPTFGRFEIPYGSSFGAQHLISTQRVNLEVETPVGTLRNREPAIMQANVNQIPPATAYVQQGLVPMYDAAGNIVVTKTNASSAAELDPRYHTV
jgi:hypothetical protein